MSSLTFYFQYANKHKNMQICILKEMVTKDGNFTEEQRRNN